MNTTLKTMRLNIEGKWSVENFANSLLSIRDLYNLRLVLEIFREDSRDLEMFWMEMQHFPPFRRWTKSRRLHPLMLQFPYYMTPSVPLDSVQLAHLAAFTLPDEDIQITRVQYGSPGFKDLTGIGDIVGHVKDFIVRIIELWSERDSRHLDNEKKSVEIERLRIENAREFVKLAKECGYTESELRKMTNWVNERQEILMVLIGERKIRSAHILDDKMNQEHKS